MKSSAYLLPSIGNDLYGLLCHFYMKILTPLLWFFENLNPHINKGGSTLCNVTAPIQSRGGRESQHLKKGFFFSRIDPSLFTSIAPELLDCSNETGWVFWELKLTGWFLPQSMVSCRSDSSSEANSSCCHKSDAWSYLKRVESSIISLDSNITNDIVRKVINAEASQLFVWWVGDYVWKVGKANKFVSNYSWEVRESTVC